LADIIARVFSGMDSNSQSHKRDDPIIVWGTAQSCAKLTGDSDNGSEAALIGDCRLVSLFGGKLAAVPFGLLQQNPQFSESLLPANVGYEG
jgi:hypothetical protein